MILDKVVTVGLNGRNFKTYESLGYTIPREYDSKGRYVMRKGSKICVKIEHLQSSKIKVLCRCEDCSLERYVNYDSLIGRKNSIYLKSGETLCVKCAAKRFSGVLSPKYKHGCNRFCEYRLHARDRNIIFDLPVEDFKRLITQPCHYCNGFSTYKNKQSRGNGIDRKDSNIGYIIDNCVPCCATCNFVKNSMPYSDFITYIRSIYENTKNYEI